MPNVPLSGAFAAHDSHPHPHEGRLRLTLRLRAARAHDPRALLDAAALLPGARCYLSSLEVAERHGASVEDMEAVVGFARRHGIAVRDADPATRRVVVEGEAARFAELFGFAWHRVTSGAGQDPVPAGELRMPAELSGIVVGVLGLDQRPRLRPHVRHPMDDDLEIPGSPTAGYSGADLAARYAFPEGRGEGLRVGVIELGGGFDPADLDRFFANEGLKVAPVRVVTVDGGTNDPVGSPLLERFEVALDLQVLGSVVPEATLTAYFAPNTDQGFMDALQAALHDPEGPPSVISVSWGGAESAWAPLDFVLFDDVLQQAAAQGVTVVCSSGDYGSRDGLTDGRAHVVYPAASAWALGVGGTSWPKEAGPAFEKVWNNAPKPGATGGGVSDLTDLPDWQKDAGVPPSINDGQVRRGVPDVAAVADQATGYRIVVGGKWWMAGGTSAAAPLWAGLVARLHGALGAPCGLLNPLLYGAARAALRPITEGGNGDYEATKGYSACTGQGSPDGQALLTALGGKSHPPTGEL